MCPRCIRICARLCFFSSAAGILGSLKAQSESLGEITEPNVDDNVAWTLLQTVGGDVPARRQLSLG